MKKQIKLLDCTLRDGGYINDWNFGYRAIRAVLHKLIEAKTDYIEVGFLRNCEYSNDITLYNNIAELKNVLPSDKSNSKYSIMALHNFYDVSKLEKNDGIIDIVRVTFHNYDIDEGMTFVQRTMDKGYNVFCNPINIMGYSDCDLLDLLEKINKVQPYGFSIVDTFGSMMKSDLLRIYLLVEHNLNKSIKIGLHLHENLGISYSLAQNFIEICNFERDAIVDASLLGMGRVPGNLCIELMMDYMNKYQNGQYNTNAAYDAIDDHIVSYKETEAWGYSTAYALSAKYNLHRNYSEYLVGQGKLRAKDINQILAGINNDKKAAYDKDYIEQLYIKYQNNMINDMEAKNLLWQKLQKNKIVVLAPGNSLNAYKDKILNFIKENDPIIIAVNYDDSIFGSIYNFYTNIRRFDQYMVNDSKKINLITSNIRSAVTDKCIIFNYYDLACDENGLFDNSVIMLLRLLSSINIKEVNIAGFDGYSASSSNYAYESHAIDKHDFIEQNRIIARYIIQMHKKIDINFITPSLYIKP
jgi:4-hydroxy 2-oxovalerate aldolase